MELNYKKFGDGDPVIIVHGLFGSLDNWLTIAKKIAGEGYAVFLVDQRNHGKSPHDPAFDYQAMSDDLLAFMDQHQLHKAYLIGHSMGGKTVMKFATHHDDRIERLMVVDIAPKYYPPHHETIIKALRAVDFDMVSNRKDVQDTLGEYIKDTGVQQFLLKNLERVNSSQFRWKMNLEVIADKIDNVGEALKENEQSDVKTLFVAGQNSDYIKSDDRDLLNKHFPNAQLLTIKNAGHWIHVEQPGIFFKTVLSFLNG